MYKSPIELFVSNIQTQQEEGVLRAIQNVGVNVDKDELIKCLQYDRHQYEKGYFDGMHASNGRWFSVEDGEIPEGAGKYLCCYKLFSGETFVDVLYFSRNLEDVDEFVFAGENHPGWYIYDHEYGYTDRDVTHWMPLPEMPEQRCVEEL